MFQVGRPAEGRSKLEWWVATACWTYAAAAMALWSLFRVAGDRWWVATVLLFAHRWVWAVPLAALLPLAVLVPRRRYRRTPLWALAVGAAVVLGPVMGLCVPWQRLAPPLGPAASSSPPRLLRVLTCNTHAEELDAPALARELGATRPDVVLLQDWGADPRVVFGPSGEWNVLVDGELCLGSRYPVTKLRDVFRRPDSGHDNACAYRVETPGGPVCLYNVHMATPHPALRAVAWGAPDAAAGQLEDNSARRLQQAAALARDARAGGGGEPVVLAGDFNMPCDSGVFREALAGFDDAFARAGFGYGWTYRARGTFARIDHVLTGPGWACRRCWVGPDVGSRHRPLIAELERPAVASGATGTGG